MIAFAGKIPLRSVAGMAAMVVALTAGSARFHPASAQIALADALLQADRLAYGNRIANADVTAQDARAIAPLKGIIPTLRFEAGYVRTTDPIGVFGSTLRQRSVTQANFDPQRLNYPDALGNHQGAVILEQPLFNADAWIGRRAAVQAAEASRESRDWTRTSIRVDVVRAYYGAVLAVERASTLRAAARAARAHVSQAEALVRQGLATKSDALLASVRAGAIDAQLAGADGEASNARHGLAVLLGRESTPLVLPAELPSADRIREVVASDTANILPTRRADVQVARLGLDAARENAKRAHSLLLPRINSFARYDWNSPTRVFGGGRNWTIGLLASWSPFTNAADIADLREADARGDAARAQAEAAEANAALELEKSRTALQVALARLSIAERAIAQSREAHRIVGRKYEGGLASVAELLDAQAVETQSAVNLSYARWSVIVAAAERRRALGGDPGYLQALDEPRSQTTERD